MAAQTSSEVLPVTPEIFLVAAMLYLFLLQSKLIVSSPGTASLLAPGTAFCPFLSLMSFPSEKCNKNVVLPNNREETPITEL